ncbi:histone deacetylase, partial [Sarracenia purpurea var. burkii]
CSISDMGRYKRGVLPSAAPSKSYANVIVEALVKGKRLSRDAAEAYIKKASEAIKIFTANA